LVKKLGSPGETAWSVRREGGKIVTVRRRGERNTVKSEIFTTLPPEVRGADVTDHRKKEGGENIKHDRKRGGS